MCAAAYTEVNVDGTGDFPLLGVLHGQTDRLVLQKAEVGKGAGEVRLGHVEAHTQPQTSNWAPDGVARQPPQSVIHEPWPLRPSPSLSSFPTPFQNGFHDSDWVIFLLKSNTFSFGYKKNY